jgi:hypothetical protein
VVGGPGKGAGVAKKTTSHDDSDVNLKSRSMRIPQLAAPAASGSNALRSLPEYAGKSPALAAASLQEFLAKGQRTIALSGAGISVDSNIPDYRGTARGLFYCLARHADDVSTRPFRHLYS